MELELVKAVLKRRAYDLLVPKVSREQLSNLHYGMITWIGSALKANPDREEITPEELKMYIEIRNKTKLDEAGVKLLLQECDRLASTKELPSSLLLDTLIQSELVGKMGRVVNLWNSGQEVEPLKEIKELIVDYDIKPQEESELYDINEILADVHDGKGVVFNSLKNDQTEVPILQEYVQPLIEGSTILLGSRTGQGKSTQVAYLVARSARSAYEYFGKDRPVIVGVNEGNFRRAVPRLYQSALNMTASEIGELSRQGKLIQAFEDVVGVPHDYIRYVPMYGWDTNKLEEFIDKNEPSMLWLDMVEHLGTPRPMEETLKLKYQWEFMRRVDLQYNMIGIGTAQLSDNAVNNFFPPENTVAYSRTAVQAVSELTLMMGAMEGEDYYNTRGWNLVKSKFGIEGLPSLKQQMVYFDHERGVFSIM